MVPALLILILFAVLWPQGFRAALGCLSVLIGFAILWGLTIWAAVAWLNMPLSWETVAGAAVALFLILWEGSQPSPNPEP